MNLFDWDGPREWLTCGCFIIGMTIESIIEEGVKLVAKGTVIVLDTIEHGFESKDVWIAEQLQGEKWTVSKSKDEGFPIMNEKGEPEFGALEEVNRNIKRFIARQLQCYLSRQEKIEEDPWDDVPLEAFTSEKNVILAVQRIF